MVSGGHLNDDRGLDVTNIFDPVSESWASGLPSFWHPPAKMFRSGTGPFM